MNVTYYALGVLLIFLTKIFVNNRTDDKVDVWRRVFEIPADLTLLSFLMGIAGTAELQTYDRHTQGFILGVIALSMISVYLFKKNAKGVSGIGGGAQFESVPWTIAILVLNSGIAVLSMYISYMYLGANSG